MGIASHLLTNFLLVIFVITSAQSVSARSLLTHGHDKPANTIQGLLAPKLRLPEGYRVQQILSATGYQIYTYNGTNWVTTNVSADLYDFKGVKVGYHFFLPEKDSNGGQPTWEKFHPFSRVTGRAIASDPQDGAIPWVLLEATSSSGSSKSLASTKYIQRFNTHKGQSPRADVSANKGDVVKSAYFALYAYAR